MFDCLRNKHNDGWFTILIGNLSDLHVSDLSIHLLFKEIVWHAVQKKRNEKNMKSFL